MALIAMQSPDEDREWLVSLDPERAAIYNNIYDERRECQRRGFIKLTADFDISGGGSVETFDNGDDAKQRYEYVRAVTKGNPLFAEYNYLEGNAVLRLSGA